MSWVLTDSTTTPPTGKELIELRIRAAVDVVPYNNTVAGLENAEHGMNRRQAGGERKTARSLLKLGDLLFQEVTCGIAAARIVVTGHRVDLLEGICR